MPFLEFGVYRAKIEEPTGKLKNLIYVNPDNKYTSEELGYIKEHGLKVTILGTKDNYIHYPRDSCMTGSQVFGDFAKYVYELKKKGIKGTKSILNNIWGKLIRYNKMIKYHNVSDGEFEIPEGWDIIETLPIGRKGNRFRVQLIKTAMPFEYPLARMYPFFMAKCRLVMARKLEPFIEHIYYSHTDSMWADIPLPFKNTGDMGDIRFEGVCKEAYIQNATKRTCPELFIDLTDKKECEYFELVQYSYKLDQKRKEINMKAKRIFKRHAKKVNRS
jgi:hypothetical protein